jgi:hypothetical protein
MDEKNGDFMGSRLGGILTGVTINLAAGAVVLLLAKICLPEQIVGPGAWKIWLSLLISVLAVGTVIWLGINQWMALKSVRASQAAMDELADGMRRQSSDALKVRDQLESQIEGLGRRTDEVAGEAAGLQKTLEADLTAVRRQLTDKIDALGQRIDEASAGMTSSLNALEEAKMHEAVAARKLMLDQVAQVGKRIDELKGAGGGPNPALDALRQGLARLTQDLAELRKAVDGLRGATAAAPAPAPVIKAPAPQAKAAPGEQPRIIPAKAPEKTPPAPQG